MSYVEYPAAGDLARFAECVWSRRVEASEPLPARHLVLPDTCADVLVDRGRRRAFVVGTMTVAQEVALAQPTEIVAIRFRPGGGFPILGLPLSELTDEVVELGDVRADAEEILEKLDGLDAAEAAAVLGRELATRPLAAPPPEPLWWATIGTLTSEAAPAVGAVSDRFGMSRQYLTRRVKELVGIGPKRLARVSRLRRLIALVDTGEPGGWAGAAAGAGYYDQSHMIGEVKALTGLTPSELRPGIVPA